MLEQHIRLLQSTCHKILFVCTLVFDCQATSDGLVPGPLGMESGDIKIFQLLDNSPVSWTSYPPWYGRLNDASCFWSTTNDKHMRVRTINYVSTFIESYVFY